MLLLFPADDDADRRMLRPSTAPPWLGIGGGDLAY